MPQSDLRAHVDVPAYDMMQPSILAIIIRKKRMSLVALISTCKHTKIQPDNGPFSMQALPITTHSAETVDQGGSSLVEILPVTTVTVPPYTTTNAVFFGTRAFWIIDPGTPYGDQQQLLTTYINHRVANGGEFIGVCLTHHHGDHTKAAEYLSRYYDVPIIAHQNAAQFVAFVFHPVNDGHLLTHAHGHALRVMYTPGHALDHVVYYDEETGILIAGDMITDRGTILIPPVGGSLSIYLENLEKLSRLPLTAIIPAHGYAITQEPTRFLIKAIQHRYQRIKAVFAAIIDEHHRQDATDITRLVYGGAIDENLMVFAQLSVESSLQWLKDAGLVMNPHHYWQLTNAARSKHDNLLLRRLEEIDERLRNS